MARPIILGVVGDSASGKTTITKGLVGLLGEDAVTHIGTDDYHKYDRTERSELGITPLHPDCNYIDIIAQHVHHLRNGEPILKPVYQHHDGTFGRPEYVFPKRFVVIEGLLGYYTKELAEAYDVRVYLAPPEDLRRDWKIKRDTSKRGYTEEKVLEELDKREPDSEAFIRPQERLADLVVSFQPSGDDGDAEHLDAVLTLRKGLPHPDLSVIDEEKDRIRLEQRGEVRCLHVPGDVDRERGAAIEEAIWQKMQFASQLRTERLGEFTVGDEVHRSESLAIVQVLILYHLVTAKAAVAVSGDATTSRADGSDAESAPAQGAAAATTESQEA
ncbi:MAG TPA: phosphoribulokinase [Solirubrobacteraceae bacterium]|jgi:phosphoribulokinase|nr:phosphoribulokinase [Solirubrobacteraceae bacterium]